MTPELFGTACVLSLVTLLLRLGGRAVTGSFPWRSKFALGGDFGDAMTHLLLAEVIRRNGRKMIKRTPEFLMSGPQDYPAFFHWLLARLPKRRVEQLEWLFSPVIESMHAAIVFLTFHFLINRYVGHSALSLSSLLTLVWILSPGLSLDVRRGAFLNERVFGFLFSNTYFLCLIGWLVTSNPFALAGAVLAGCIVAISSKFGMQAIILITPLVAIVLWDLQPLGPLALTILCAMAFTGGYAPYVWRGSMRHTAFYARYLLHVGDYVTSFATRQLLDAFRLLRSGSVRTALRLALGHPLLKCIFNSPAVWLALGLIMFQPETSPAERAVFAVVLAAVAVALITSTDTFKYLGEGERYLEVAIAPALFGVVMVSQEAGWFYALLIYSLLRLLLKWRAVARNRDPDQAQKDADTRSLLEWLSLQPSLTIYSVPGRLAFPVAYRSTQHRYVWWFLNAPERPRQQEFERLFEGGNRYPYPSPQQAYASWEGMRADIALLHLPTITACKDAWGYDYAQIEGRRLFANDTYMVVGLTGACA